MVTLFIAYMISLIHYYIKFIHFLERTHDSCYSLFIKFLGLLDLWMCLPRIYYKVEEKALLHASVHSITGQTTHSSTHSGCLLPCRCVCAFYANIICSLCLMSGLNYSRIQPLDVDYTPDIFLDVFITPPDSKE